VVRIGDVRSAFLSRALAGGLALLPVPIVAGDLPDPSAIFDNGQSVAVVTANGWAPSMRILTSPDLAHWQLRGAVFNRPPSWVKVNIWAPEITRLQSGRYAVFYSARSKRKGDPWFCIGVATSASATGPYRDLGRPIRCGKYGSIDPYPTRDENGKLFLLYKDDGNEFKRTTHIYAQPLAEDARSVSGTPKELLRDDSKWEGKVVEGPSIVRANGYFHMLYSGGLFGGTRGCNYALGVARAKSLLGPWEKNPANPILKTGNGWKCPGHGTIYNAGPNGLTAIYHAYPAGSGVIAGRQMIAEPASVGADNWLHIGDDGTPPRIVPGAASLNFRDTFPKGPLNLNWEWPFERRPGMATGNGLRLRGSARGKSRLDAGVIARRTATAKYTATAVLDRAGLKGAAQGGLASYRNEFEAIGVSVSRGQMTVWQRRFGKFKQLGKATAPTAKLVQLRMIARGDNFRFQSSTNGKTWKAVGRRSYHGPIEESARVALTAGGARGATARFTSAGLSAN
jgi:xylan 1,4-beta-xylosidase